MRLSEAKIRYLAARTVEWLADRDDVGLRATPGEAVRTVAAAIREELRREDELDQDVERLMARHRRDIAGQGADPEILRQKIKRQLAKERGIVL